MKKRDIVRKKEQFNSIIQHNRSIQNKYFVVYMMTNETNLPKFGIAVGKKIGNAVVRNKLKRQYRIFIDRNILLFPKENDYIIMVKKASLCASFEDITESMKILLTKEENK